MRAFLITATLVVGLAATTFAADSLKLNPNLDYTSDSQDGPLITGTHGSRRGFRQTFIRDHVWRSLL